MRYRATITRLNSTQATCDIIAASLTLAQQAAMVLIGDGETVCVEPAGLVTAEIELSNAIMGDTP